MTINKEINIIGVKVNPFTALEVGVAKSDKLYISRYNDFYGCLLTEHQCEMIRLYYDCDISLFEIAEQFGISRQAVRDSIKRAEQSLVLYEEKLGLCKKFSEMSDLLAKIDNEFLQKDYQKAKDDLDELKKIMEDNDGDF